MKNTYSIWLKIEAIHYKVVILGYFKHCRVLNSGRYFFAIVSLRKADNLSVAAHASNSSICETEARESQVQGQPGQFSKALSQNKK